MNTLTEFRKKHHYTQAQVANILGVHQTAISQWETGKTLPDIMSASKLALLFGVAIEDLLDSTAYASLMTISKIRISCGKLDELGQQKVLDYANDLIATGKYNKPQHIASE